MGQQLHHLQLATWTSCSKNCDKSYNPSINWKDHTWHTRKPMFGKVNGVKT